MLWFCSEKPGEVVLDRFSNVHLHALWLLWRGAFPACSETFPLFPGNAAENLIEDYNGGLGITKQN